MTHHADFCGWHVDQHAWECTCGAIKQTAKIDMLIENNADKLSPEEFRDDNINFIWRTAVKFGMEWERAQIIRWLREDEWDAIADDIEAEDHLKHLSI